MSCGTGATACALTWDSLSNLALKEITVKVKGGKLKVQFERDGKGGYREIYLIGPAKLVYHGVIEV